MKCIIHPQDCACEILPTILWGIGKGMLVSKEIEEGAVINLKKLKHMREYPFLAIIIGSAILFTAIGYIGKNNVYADYSVDFIKTPQLTVVFEGMKEGKYPWEMSEYKRDSIAEQDDTINRDGDKSDIADAADNNTNNEGGGQSDNESNSGNPEPSGKPADGGSSEPSGKPADGGSSEPSGKPMDGGNSENTPNTDKAGTEVTPSLPAVTQIPVNSEGDGTDSDSATDTYSFVTVKKSYYNDALFIGDSRTVGLSEYSGWDKPTYFADVGLTIYTVFDKEIAEVDGRKMTIEKALKKESFKKIYIMLGINELGRGTTKTFIAEYEKVIERIQKLQPGAIIFVEAIMNVSEAKSNSDPIFNNVNIKDKNDHLALLADNKNIFYIDVNEAITDKSGGIPEKYTFDNIHLKAEYYSIWTDFLLKHGVIKE